MEYPVPDPLDVEQALIDKLDTPKRIVELSTGKTHEPEPENIQTAVSNELPDGAVWIPGFSYSITETIDVKGDGSPFGFYTEGTARFVPQGDYPALNFTDVRKGYLRPGWILADNITSNYAVEFNGCEYNDIPFVYIDQSYNGMEIDSSADYSGSKNFFGLVSIRNSGNIGLHLLANSSFHYCEVLGDADNKGDDAAIRWDSGAGESNFFYLKGKNHSFGIDMGALQGEEEGRIFQFTAERNTGDGIRCRGYTHKRFQIYSIHLWNNGRFGFFVKDTGEIQGWDVGKIWSGSNDSNGVLIDGTMTDCRFGHITSVNNGSNGLLLRGSSSGTVVEKLKATGNTGYNVDLSGLTGTDRLEINEVTEPVTSPEWAVLNGVGREAAGAGNAPTAANWKRGDIVENTDDNTIWVKTTADSMVQIG